MLTEAQLRAKRTYRNSPKGIATRKAYEARTRDRHKKICKAWRDKIKAAVMQLYGGCCYCCGESLLPFLTLDHLDGKGRIERKLNNAIGNKWYKQLLKQPKRDDLRVACYNCNSGAFANGGICPHVSTKL